MASNVLPHPRVWFITGCSTGFGRALAEAVLAHGDRLVATARHPERLQDLGRSSPAQFSSCLWMSQTRIRARMPQPKQLSILGG